MKAPQGQRSGEARTATSGHGGSGTDRLMEWVVERDNVTGAGKRVWQNKGSPGVDGRTVEELPTYLAAQGEAIRAQWLDGTYSRSRCGHRRFRRAGGAHVGHSVRARPGHPAEPPASPPADDRPDLLRAHSHGFRPGHNAHHAVGEAQRYIQEGKRVVVDVEHYFDRVTHPLLPVPIRVAEFQKAVTTEAHAFLWSAFGQDWRALRWTSPTQRLAERLAAFAMTLKEIQGTHERGESLQPILQNLERPIVPHGVRFVSFAAS